VKLIRGKAAGGLASDPRARLKRAERDEARRFTATSRRRVRIRATIVGGLLAIAGLVAAIVLSPLMALEKIEVTGLVTLDESIVVGAVSEQIGRPLATLDFDDVTSKLGTVPQIESFATELRPPHTLVIRIVERVAVGSIRLANGYDIVDAAGVVIGFSEEEPAGIPLIFSNAIDSPGFDAIVNTLLALPAELRVDVKSISAESRDSVTFLVRSSAHEIRWGSDELPEHKAAVVTQALALAASRGGAFVIDVSAPDTLVMTPRR
jgi:cell division protein FtsQ